MADNNCEENIDNSTKKELSNVILSEEESVSVDNENEKKEDNNLTAILRVRIEALQNDYTILKKEHEEKIKELESSNFRIKEMELINMRIENDNKKLNENIMTKEKEFQNSIQQLTNKMETNINNLNIKLKNAENEKNSAVIRYATKETEIMRLTKDNGKLKDELQLLKKEYDELKENTSQEAIDKLKKNIEILQEDIFREKKEKEKILNDYGMAEKRISASHTTIKEMKDKMNSMVIENNNISAEKDKALEEAKNFKSQIQVLQIKAKETEYQFNEKIKSRDHLYREVMEEMSRLRGENNTLTQKLISFDSESDKIRTEKNDLKEKLDSMIEENETLKKELDELRIIKELVDEYKFDKNEAIKLKKIAETEKEEFERDNVTLRSQVEELLSSNHNFQEKSLKLVADIENYQERVKNLEKDFNDKECFCNDLSKEVDALKKEKEGKVLVEVNKLDELLCVEERLTKKVNDMEKRVQELENEKMVIRKKSEATQKDLRMEVKRLRKQLETQSDKCSLQNFQLPSHFNERKCSTDPILTCANSESINISSNISRTSSLNSFETAAGYRSGSASNTQTSSPNKEDINDMENGKDTFKDNYQDINASNNVNVQQVMIDKIVKLQKLLVKKTEKIEFLEEHIKQCVEELKKKTKIIQNYALREEAAMLKPMNESLEEVAIRMKESSTPLFGTWFNGKGKEKSSLTISAEINSRLQALIEDLLLKNMEYKEAIDKLDSKIAILEREKRQLEAAATI
uniref:GRIP domain-containing protein n=1 Tax=Strongyloides papillosus TaxID=174720 RepID=A0A0N5BCV7_STREA